MIIGVIGLSMMFGTIAATYSVMSGGSLLFALGVYSLSGVLVSLAVAAVVVARAKRQDGHNLSYLAITPAE